jgi:5-methylcytosine-specific restriction endonuclease McrA
MDAAAREFIRQRARNQCEYCLLPDESDELPFHIEHVIAKQHGGSDELTNLCWSCSRCNFYKGTNIASLDRETGELTALFNPRNRVWKSHFELRDAHIVGLTAEGRITVRLLHMNVTQRIDLRRDLIRRGIIHT